MRDFIVAGTAILGLTTGLTLALWPESPSWEATTPAFRVQPDTVGNAGEVATVLAAAAAGSRPSAFHTPDVDIVSAACNAIMRRDSRNAADATPTYTTADTGEGSRQAGNFEALRLASYFRQYPAFGGSAANVLRRNAFAGVHGDFTATTSAGNAPGKGASIAGKAMPTSGATTNPSVSGPPRMRNSARDVGPHHAPDVAPGRGVTFALLNRSGDPYVNQFANAVSDSHGPDPDAWYAPDLASPLRATVTRDDGQPICMGYRVPQRSRDAARRTGDPAEIWFHLNRPGEIRVPLRPPRSRDIGHLLYYGSWADLSADPSLPDGPVMAADGPWSDLPRDLLHAVTPETNRE
ncbi:MAG TPA: hypothetical protein VGC09_03780 [Rhodopila sp.]